MRAALDEDAPTVEEADAGDVAQTPLEAEVVIAAEAAEVGVDEVIGAKVDDELDGDGEVEDDVVAMPVTVAVGSVRDDAGLVLVVEVVDPATVVAAVDDDAVAVVDEEVVADDVVVVCAAAD